MNELKPEDVMKDMAQYVHCANIMGSATLSKDEMNAIFALLRDKQASIEMMAECIKRQDKELAKKDAEIERLTAQIEHCDACDRIGLTYSEHIICIKQARAEAIDEFAENLTGHFNICEKAMYSETTVHEVIMHIAKELKGEK